MASPSPPSFNSSTSSATPTHHHSRAHFTPIQECEREEQEEDCFSAAAVDRGTSPKHHPTPLNRCKNGKSQTVKKRSESESDSVSSSDGPVSCNRCRPHVREKISVVPLDNNNNGVSKQTYFSSMASPNGIFKSLISSLTRKSPKSINESSSLTAREEQWKTAVTELSQKLVQTTRKRDEAIMEASRLKYAMAELEKKLDKLETYCHSLKSGIEECSGGGGGNSPCQIQSFHQMNQKQIIEHFLVSVSESRSSIRLLSRSLTLQLRHVGAKVYERISVLLQPYDIKISFSKNPRSLLFYLEALLNQAFFEDFESIGFQKNASTQVLNPIERCEANFGGFNFLHGLTWEEVLNKGTKHFSEDFSRFCDRKMSEIVAMLGWNRAWPEPLLQAFFGASKSVWLLHLLANSVHPNLPIFRVEKEADFDSVYMEDMGGDKARKLIPSLVRIMIAPGFYVYGSVVKCKVLCRYNAAVTAAALSP